MKTIQQLALVLIITAFTQGCQPAPRHLLTTDEKIADLHWIFSQFKENYAPLNYKEKLHGIDFQTLKANYTGEAVLTKTNEEFFVLMHRFVSEFKDAHT